MAEYIGIERKARRAYGFDEIALVPGRITVDPDDVDTSWTLGPHTFPIPILASAMDGVVDVSFAAAMGKAGGLAVLNLEGVQTRYENPAEVLDRIVKATPDQATRLIQEIYQEPIKERLIGERIQAIKRAGVKAAVSAIPLRAERFAAIAQEAGCDVFVVQATVVSRTFVSSKAAPLDLAALKRRMKIPLVVGNVVTYEACMDLFECGVDAVLVGVGPGAACTTRGVIGVGVPQVTATCDAADARDEYYKQTGRYVPIITDGGMRVGGDVCKAFACGSDAVMIGSMFARAQEAPGKGFHWGMATSHRNLPRGTRIHVGVAGPLEEILFGPARIDDGSENLVGALRNSMGVCGARNIREMHRATIVIAPSIQHEGKLFQRAQNVGMGKSVS
jgi:IMP dehydrogenase